MSESTERHKGALRQLSDLLGSIDVGQSESTERKRCIKTVKPPKIYMVEDGVKSESTERPNFRT